MARVRKCMGGVRRGARGQGPQQVRGIRWEQADEVCALAESAGHVAGLRDAALVAVMSDALLRVSEASAIDCAAIRLLEDGSGLLLRAALEDGPGWTGSEALPRATDRGEDQVMDRGGRH